MNTKITNFTDTVSNLAKWIDSIRELAANGGLSSVAWFYDTMDTPISIVAGWMKGFDAGYSDLLYINKNNPSYALGISIVVNPMAATYSTLDGFDMPISSTNVVEDITVTIELEDNSEALAVFFLGEWERVMEACK